MHFIIVLVIMLLLPACSLFQATAPERDSAPLVDVDVSRIPNAVPKKEPLSHYGNNAYYALHKRYTILTNTKGFHQRGIASWYGTKFHHRRTSSGEPYNLYAMTGAHTRLPIPSYVRITNLENHREIIVKINDRGPFSKDRIVDLSYVAAKKLGMLQRGTALVEIAAIDVDAPIVAHRPIIVSKKTTPHHTSHKFYLQLGAFGQRSNAEKLSQKIRHLTSYPVKLQNQQHLYQVRIGPLPSIARSDSLSKTLSQKGMGKALVVTST